MNELKFNQLKAKKYNHIPVYKKITIDTDTALGLYLKLANNKYSYLFESVEGGEKWARYSIIGLSAETIIKVFKNSIHLTTKIDKQIFVANDPLLWIENYINKFKVPDITELSSFNGGLVGYFGYETISYIEPKLKNSINKDDKLGVADILLMLSNDLLVFDNLSNCVYIITHIDPKINSFQDGINTINTIEKLIHTTQIPTTNIKKNTNNVFSSNIDKDEYKNMVNKIKHYIQIGDCMQVVPSQRFVSDFNDKPINLYRKLRTINPSPYMYYLNLDDFYIVGSSPEILVKVTKDNIATLKPIAGTRKRGKTAAEDKKLIKELLADEKEIAEHLMLIDLGRNDLGRIAKTGKVKLIDKMTVEKYSHVMHIVSSVECEIKDNISNMDVLRATFPAGTLSGAPKIKAMQIIAEIEPIKRNIYAGAIGYLAFNNTMDMAIAIRTAVIKDNKIHIQAGGGVVYDSKPEAEWQESINKANALIHAANK